MAWTMAGRMDAPSTHTTHPKGNEPMTDPTNATQPVPTAEELTVQIDALIAEAQATAQEMEDKYKELENQS